MEPGVSHHALLYVRNDDQVKKGNLQFKFVNSVIDMEGYQKIIEEKWKENVNGSPMITLWKKLMKMKPIIRGINKSLYGIKSQIE